MMTATQHIENIFQQPAEFQWDPSMIGIISTIMAYGGLFSIFGVSFVTKLGGSVSATFVLTVCGIFTILQPAALYLNFELFVGLRLLTGFFAVTLFRF